MLDHDLSEAKKFLNSLGNLYGIRVCYSLFEMNCDQNYIFCVPMWVSTVKYFLVINFVNMWIFYSITFKNISYWCVKIRVATEERR